MDKSAFCGGNSTKATSGINGAETQTQKVRFAVFPIICVYMLYI